ncbi:uncharacterized protein [Medicago truncatula]|uniref:uncharacterized protein isoform X2 n=1 Tax=Medicago truncatula TaxID=3880 RepID=UPI0019687D32|nr:uncharacterized protein LOC120580890 isoform X2 [Medicago truncatula]XP_039691038.1 uncharacterized protein LOC120580890 isoform X2 [Medicago truncatula]
MPPKQKEKGKSKDPRRRFTTHIADPATLATLTPFPRQPSSSSQGSTGSSQASAYAPVGFILPTGYQLPPPPSFPHGQTGFMIPQHQQPPPPQHQQPPPQPQPQPQPQQGADDDDEEMADYPQDEQERYIIVPSGNSFMPCKPAASAIRDIIQGRFHGFWKTYGDIPDDEKDAWFGLFEMKCTWNPRYYAQIRRNFHIRASARLSDMLRHVRLRHETAGKRPYWIGEPLMRQLVDYWGSPEFKAKSEKAKKNRASEKGGCIHTGGCISTAEHARRLAKKLGREPYINELHKKTHTYRSGQYVDDRSKICQEEYDRQLSEALSRGCSVDEALTLRAWTKVAGEKKKGRLYGAGNLAGNYRKGVATTLKLTLNAGEGSSRQPELTPEMRDLITRLTQEQLAAHMQTQQDLIHEVVRKQREFLDSQLDTFRQEQGWNMNEQGVGQQSGSRESVRAPPVCDDDADDPYEVYGEGEEDDDVDDLEMDD